MAGHDPLLAVDVVLYLYLDLGSQHEADHDFLGAAQRTDSDYVIGLQ